MNNLGSGKLLYVSSSSSIVYNGKRISGRGARNHVFVDGRALVLSSFQSQTEDHEELVKENVSHRRASQYRASTSRKGRSRTVDVSQKCLRRNNTASVSFLVVDLETPRSDGEYSITKNSSILPLIFIRPFSLIRIPHPDHDER